MEERRKKRAFGVTFTGNVTFQGPMFDIHDNEHVHLSAEKMPCEEQTDELMEMATDITQPPDEEELNYFLPTLHLKRLGNMEWYKACRTNATYSVKWWEDVVDALMEGEWRDTIARDWSDHRKRIEVRGYFMGIMKDGGALKGSYDSISMVAHIISNTRTFSRYMSRAKKKPYYTWLLGYIKNSMENV